MPTWGLLATLGAASCFLMMPIVATFNGPPGLVRAFVGFSTIGCILAQGVSLAAWLAWGDLPFGRRLLQHWTVATLLCLVWLLGLFRGTSGRVPAEVGFTVAMTVPVISLATQFPLWLMRQVFGWRLVRPAHDGLAEAEKPWAIRDLLLATLLVAVALGIARLSPAALEEGEFWIAWCIGGTAAGVVTTIAILPAGVLLMRNQRFAFGACLGWLYALSLISLLWTIVGIVRWRGLAPLPPLPLLVGLSSLTLTFASTIILAALVARTLGYRLVWGRGQKPSLAGSKPAPGELLQDMAVDRAHG